MTQRGCPTGGHVGLRSGSSLRRARSRESNHSVSNCTPGLIASSPSGAWSLNCLHIASGRDGSHARPATTSPAGARPRETGPECGCKSPNGALPRESLRQAATAGRRIACRLERRRTWLTLRPRRSRFARISGCRTVRWWILAATSDTGFPDIQCGSARRDQALFAAHWVDNGSRRGQHNDA